jgi:hypothetical protein
LYKKLSWAGKQVRTLPDHEPLDDLLDELLGYASPIESLAVSSDVDVGKVVPPTVSSKEIEAWTDRNRGTWVRKWEKLAEQERERRREDARLHGLKVIEQQLAERERQRQYYKELEKRQKERQKETDRKRWLRERTVKGIEEEKEAVWRAYMNDLKEAVWRSESWGDRFDSYIGWLGNLLINFAERYNVDATVYRVAEYCFLTAQRETAEEPDIPQGHALEGPLCEIVAEATAREIRTLSAAGLATVRRGVGKERWAAVPFREAAEVGAYWLHGFLPVPMACAVGLKWIKARERKKGRGLPDMGHPRTIFHYRKADGFSAFSPHSRA